MNSASDEDIEIEARRMCQEMGYDAEKVVQCSPGQDYTEPEFVERGGHAMPWSCEIQLHPLWRVFRKDAEKSLAKK